MELIFSGIKCDNCLWRDDSVKYEDYPSFINKPCPECGANLLTEDDYKSCQQITAAAQIINKLAWLRWLNPLHYWRLIVGDKRQQYHVQIKYITPQK